MRIPDHAVLTARPSTTGQPKAPYGARGRTRSTVTRSKNVYLIQEDLARDQVGERLREAERWRRAKEARLVRREASRRGTHSRDASQQGAVWRSKIVRRLSRAGAHRTVR